MSWIVSEERSLSRCFHQLREYAGKIPRVKFQLAVSRFTETSVELEISYATRLVPEDRDDISLVWV
ncbi:hypothetical protein Plhal304r1_c012g0047631 [Plasmopara halstedii]